MLFTAAYEPHKKNRPYRRPVSTRLGLNQVAGPDLQQSRLFAVNAHVRSALRSAHELQHLAIRSCSRDGEIQGNNRAIIPNRTGDADAVTGIGP